MKTYLATKIETRYEVITYSSKHFDVNCTEPVTRVYFSNGNNKRIGELRSVLSNNQILTFEQEKKWKTMPVTKKLEIINSNIELLQKELLIF